MGKKKQLASLKKALEQSVVHFGETSQRAIILIQYKVGKGGKDGARNAGSTLGHEDGRSNIFC